MNLQDYFSSVIENLGGMVIPLEYGLCHVLVPADHRQIFQGREEVLLAFDFEVAQENPNAEFITFGSHVLDELIRLVKTKPVSTIRFGIVDRLVLSNPEEKIKKFLQIERGEISISSEKPVMDVWAAFVFRAGYISDEKMEEVMPIWVSLIHGQVVEGMRQANIFFENVPLYNYPFPDMFSIADAYKIAHVKMLELSMDRAGMYTRKDELEKESTRISEYYQDLFDENRKRMQRKGISEEKIQELKSKEGTLMIERDRQLTEMKEKYSVKTEISLDHGIMYQIPAIEYSFTVSNRTENKERVVYYNPILKTFYLGRDQTGHLCRIDKW